MVIGFSINIFNVCEKASPVAPSTVRWSQASVNFIRLPGTTILFFTTGTCLIAPTDNMHDSGELIIEVKGFNSKHA